MLSRRDRFLDYVGLNPVDCALLERAARLDVPDWWLTAGAVFQTVWNVMDGRDPTAAVVQCSSAMGGDQEGFTLRSPANQ